MSCSLDSLSHDWLRQGDDVRDMGGVEVGISTDGSSTGGGRAITLITKLDGGGGEGALGIAEEAVDTVVAVVALTELTAVSPR